MMNIIQASHQRDRAMAAEQRAKSKMLDSAMVLRRVELRAVAEAELAQLESELRFRAIIEATPVALALNDDQGNITYLNQAFVQSIGYTIQDIPTIADWWPRAYPDPQYRQWITELLKIRESFF